MKWSHLGVVILVHIVETSIGKGLLPGFFFWQFIAKKIYN
jgi:hypothetical protein